MFFDVSQQFSLPLPEVLPLLLLLGLALWFVLIAACGPLLVAFTETLYRLKGKAFYEKCALQAGQAVFLFSLPVFVLLFVTAGAAAAGIAARTPPLDVLTPFLGEAPNLRELLPSLGFPCAAAALFTAYIIGRHASKKSNPVLFLCILAAAACSLASLGIFFLVVFCCTQPELLEMLKASAPAGEALLCAQTLQRLFAEAASSSLTPVSFAYLCFSGLAAAAAVTLPWLVIRRNAADFGRDYYAFAVHYGAEWALTATLLATGAAGATLYMVTLQPLYALAQPQDPTALVAAFALPATAMLLWILIAFDKNPLRRKPGIVIACLLFFLTLCAQFFTFLNALPVL